MNIAIDARFYGLEHAGLGRYTKNLVEQLARIDQTNNYTLFILPAHKDLHIAHNFRVEVVDAPFYSFKEQVLLTKAIGVRRFDLVHFPQFVVPVFNMFTPFIVTIHDLIKHKYVGADSTTHSGFMYAIKHLAYRFVSWWAVKRSNHILVPTQFVKDDIVTWFGVKPEKISVTYEGVDSALTSFSQSEQTQNEVLSRFGVSGEYVIYVGSAYPYKRVDVLVDALTHLPENISLVLVGSRNVFYQKIEEIVRVKGLLHRVHLLGYVPDEELSFLYKHAICFVSASKEEGFGIPPLEAMGLGCPVVLSDIAVHKEVCGDGAIYVNASDLRACAQTIMRIQNDHAFRSHLIANGLEQVKKYSWNEMAQKTLSMYESISESPNRKLRGICHSREGGNPDWIPSFHRNYKLRDDAVSRKELDPKKIESS
ncbi:hypothetical protein CO180_03235 [candidate division WWE3 bacterium CG_4_9_14_3_um_filter_41_6]|uniref:Glycosyltransferase family 1 protein n=1 Tax=candidate division WWE3 bacterium CG_4_10_14_0_2_um_filter_41_14 TaxID=1975072 RepID=A0A2M7THX5_UNCKA|nr:MAG: hypothetical protein COY32_04385 [candidate division WWE3 bacterium CG_4_10_14_0_2_um_filter_41_14]PJA38566.1 MAG: hypothetical protein CO180_03235 [candidate division WWE3 bacterium CG_4_9_14_3_um_filter_41_6]